METYTKLDKLGEVSLSIPAFLHTSSLMISTHISLPTFHFPVPDKFCMAPQSFLYGHRAIEKVATFNLCVRVYL